MTHVPGSPSADLASEILAGGPLEPRELCLRVLAMRGTAPPVADSLCRALLGDDPRFRRLDDGRWALAESGSGRTALHSCSFVVVDVETTGFSPPADRVIELGCVRVESGRVTGSYETLINPRRPVPGPITSLTGISWSMVCDKPTFEDVCPEFLDFLGESVFVAHNAPFDWRFIQSEVALAAGRKLLNQRLCTRSLARRLLPEVQRHGLDSIASYFNLEFQGRHRALGDALVTAEVLLRFIERAGEKGITDIETLFEFLKPASRGRKRVRKS